MLKAKPHLKNQEIADILDEIAGLLEYQQANPHRIRAFRTGARQVRSLPDPIDQIIAEKGLDSLENITGIGKGLTAVIGEYLQTGRSSLLDRLRGEVSPVDLFSQVGGIGEELAERIVRELGIRTLEELEEAAYDGRLARVKALGHKGSQPSGKASAAASAVRLNVTFVKTWRLPQKKQRRPRKGLLSLCFWRSILNTAAKLPPACFTKSLPNASIRREKPGCPSCRPKKTAGPSLPSTPIPLVLMNSAKPGTGWSFIMKKVG